jgi:hypothetical protein
MQEDTVKKRCPSMNEEVCVFGTHNSTKYSEVTRYATAMVSIPSYTQCPTADMSKWTILTSFH